MPPKKTSSGKKKKAKAAGSSTAGSSTAGPSTAVPSTPMDVSSTDSDAATIERSGAPRKAKSKNVSVQHGATKPKKRTLKYESIWRHYDELLMDATKEEIKIIRSKFIEIIERHFSKLI